jgi:peroxiredoxin
VKIWQAALVAGLLAACSPAVEPGPELPIGTEIGYRAPDLAGYSLNGEEYRLPEAPGEPTIVVFYRGADCGLCRLQLEQLQQYLPAYRRQGARVVAVTLDSPEVTRVLAEQAGLEYELVSVDGGAFERSSVMDPGQEAPLPATYIVDGDGIIHFRHVGRNAADRVSDPELLTLIGDLSRR